MSLSGRIHIPEILLADDDLDDCFFFADAVKDLDSPASLTTVRDGQELMDWLRTNPLPDVLYLDLNMPKKNGFDCLTIIKHDDRLRSLPVIILSTSSEPDIIDLVYRNGAQYYISKPTDFRTLKRVVSLSLRAVLGRLNETDWQPLRNDFVISAEAVLK